MESYVDPFTGICKYTQDHKKIEALREAMDLQKGSLSYNRLYLEMRIHIKIEGSAEEQFSNDERHSGVDFTRKGDRCILTLELKGKVSNFQVFPSATSFRDIGGLFQQGTRNVRFSSSAVRGTTGHATTGGGLFGGITTNMGATNVQASQAPPSGSSARNGGMAFAPPFNFATRGGQKKKYGKPKTATQRTKVPTQQTQQNANTNAKPNAQPTVQPTVQPNTKTNAKTNAKPYASKPNATSFAQAPHVVPPPAQGFAKNPPPAPTHLVPASISNQKQRAFGSSTTAVVPNATNQHYSTTLNNEERLHLQEWLNKTHKNMNPSNKRPRHSPESTYKVREDVEMNDMQTVDAMFDAAEAGKQTVGLMKYVYILNSYTAILRNSNRTF